MVTSSNNAGIEAAPGAGAQPRAGAPADSPRPVIRGERSGPDWLAFTFLEESFVLPIFADILRGVVGRPTLHVVERKDGFYGFTASASIFLCDGKSAPNLGKIAWGGESQRGRVYVSLTGSLCSLVEDWQPIYDLLDALGATITRLDLAYDDFQGKRTVDTAVALYKAGAFNAGGRKPVIDVAGDWIGGGDRGRTVYIGRRKHGKLLRVYEKGKQLGDASSLWVRWELELHSRDRTIPGDALLYPARYLAGAYEGTSWISETSSRIETHRKTAQITIDRQIHYASIAYGRLVNVMVRKLKMTPDDVIALLMRQGIPARLAVPLAGVGDAQTIYGPQDGNA